MNQIQNQPIDTIIRQILDSLYGLKKSPILFGVDGGQGSGKSTFLKQIKKIIDEDGKYTSISLETDNFLIDRFKRENLLISYFKNPKNIYKLWDFQSLLILLNTFMVSFNTNIHVNNLYSHISGKKDKEETFRLRGNNIILLGGPYLLAPTLPKFDFKIFLDVSRNNRLNNNISEGMARGKSFKSRKESFEKFENFFKPYFSSNLDNYNMIVDNNDFSHPFITRVNYSMNNKNFISSFKQFKIYRLTKTLTMKHSDKIIESLDQIPKVEKQTRKLLMSLHKGKRKLHGKWTHSLIAIDDTGAFAGIAIGYEREKENNLWYPQNCIYLNEFAVISGFQKLGLGRFLLETWIDYNKSIGFIKLQGKPKLAAQTNKAKWNKHVGKIYKSAGFKKYTTKPYANRTDDIYLIEY